MVSVGILHLLQLFDPFLKQNIKYIDGGPKKVKPFLIALIFKMLNQCVRFPLTKISKNRHHYLFIYLLLFSTITENHTNRLRLFNEENN